MKNSAILIFIVAYLMIPGAYGALVYGSVYDLELNPAENVIVEVNTSPIQRYLAKNGSYSFTIPVGVYSIQTQHQYQGERYRAEEIINIVDNGVYVLDLFLFPDISEDESLFEQANVTFGESDQESQGLAGWIYLAMALLVMAALVLVYVLRRKPHASSSDSILPDYTGKTDYLKKILELLKSNQGRMTQKDIRKAIPLSEAKVSLLLSELEAKERIERIKKGRGNIIIAR